MGGGGGGHCPQSMNGSVHATLIIYIYIYIYKLKDLKQRVNPIRFQIGYQLEQPNFVSCVLSKYFNLCAK